MRPLEHSCLMVGADRPDFLVGDADVFLELITQPFPGSDGIVPGSSNQAIA